jgi:DNA-binding transcriptional MerR regulator
VTTTPQRSYTIKEVAALTGLPASTLRYYESIGVIAPVARGASSGHRVYDDADLDRLMGVACMAATGMSVADMQQYVANTGLGDEAAADQVALLRAQHERLVREAEQLVLRQRYVALKIDYWTARAAGDQERAEQIGAEAATLADALKRTDRS